MKFFTLTLTLTFAFGLLLVHPAVFAFNKECINLTGTYRLPSQPKIGKSSVMIVEQEECRSISVLNISGGMIPISPIHSLDGSEGYRILGNTIILQYSGNETFSTITAHGQCLARKEILSLDQDGNLVISSPMISKCTDGYRGPYVGTYQRIR